MRKTMEKATLLSLSLMLTSAFSISSALPSLLSYYSQYSSAQVELLISVPSFAIMAMIFLSAWLSKYANERMMITSGLTMMAIGGVAPVLNQNYSFVFAMRIIFGLGIGLINARAISIISERYDGNERATLLGYRGSAEVLGSAVMSLAVGRLLLIEWKYIFCVYALAIFILVLYLIFVPNQQASAPTQGVNESGNNKFTKGTAMVTALYSVFAVVLVCINASNTLRIPLLVVEKGSGTEQQASVVLSIMMVTGIIAGICFGKLSAILKDKLIVYGLILLGVGLAILASAGNLWVLGIGAVITGFFYTVALTCLFNGVSDKLPQGIINIATSMVLVGCNLGAAGSPMVLKVIGTINAKIEAPFWTYCIVVVVIGIGIFLAAKTKKGVQK